MSSFGTRRKSTTANVLEETAGEQLQDTLSAETQQEEAEEVVDPNAAPRNTSVYKKSAYS